MRGRAGTPVPKRDVELKASGSGPIVSYQLSPEQIEKWKKEGIFPMLTREKYLQLRADGQSRTHIQRNYFPQQSDEILRFTVRMGHQREGC